MTYHISNSTGAIAEPAFRSFQAKSNIFLGCDPAGEWRGEASERWTEAKSGNENHGWTRMNTDNQRLMKVVRFT